MFNCTLCYIENDRGEYLMLHRVKKKNDVNQDKWIGVGGKFEEGESPEDCLLREVREETGLELKRYRLRGIVTFVSVGWETEYMYLYTADGYTGTLRECDEGDLEWVPKDQVEALPIWEGDKIFFRLLREDRPFFSLKLSYQGDKLVYAALDGEEMALGREKLLISACLLGRNCKYNGGNNYTPLVEELKARYELIPVCPEAFGGLKIPHEPSERVGDRVLSKSGEDVTAAFVRGAEKTAEVARRNGVRLAVLKERSPSCGCGAVYDGTFTGTVVPGDGVAAARLKEQGVAIYGESRMEELL